MPWEKVSRIIGKQPDRSVNTMVSPEKRLFILKSPVVFPMRRGFSHHFRFFLFFRFLNCTLHFKGIRLGPRTFWTFFPTFWLEPLSVANNSVGSPTAAASHVDHNRSAHVARSGRSRTDAVICSWKVLGFLTLSFSFSFSFSFFFLFFFLYTRYYLSRKLLETRVTQMS